MRALYRRLAWDGIRKNKQLYFPYLLTGSVMVMIFYILYAMTDATWMASVRGSGWAVYVMQLGSIVIGVFSLLFLFYTNSFLVRQRYKEFGLYNVLGMDKRNISRVLFWENLYVALITLLCGFILGIAMSKAAELALMNLLHQPIDYRIRLSPKAMVITVLVYGGIFLLLLLNSLIRVRRAKPLELIKTASMGERMPKFLWVEALAGVVLLGYAYYLAVAIQEPLSALIWFFIAVLLVILATYALFLAGSVVLCKLLKKNKKYYYKANHFVSVSSMMFRMRRNGAGLASICVLATMVLVMLSSSACLYFGAEDSLNATYPNEFELTVWVDDSAELPKLEEALNRAGAPYGVNIWEKGTVTQDGEIIWSAAFDTGLSREQQLALGHAVGDALSSTGATWGYSYTLRAEAADDFYGTYGSLFFIGIVLSIMFICAAVLIIYYKQLCEGYEDQPRFAIMQKVGMTAADIRRSVNSQLLTVFFLPLAGAALHMAFAFPMIRRMLLLFELHNTGLFVATVLISFAVLAAVYTLVYKATSNAYYRIVKNSV